MVGMSIRDAAALMGIHSAIDDHDGEGDPVFHALSSAGLLLDTLDTSMSMLS
jgi:hypothetical protein